MGDSYGCANSVSYACGHDEIYRNTGIWRRSNAVGRLCNLAPRDIKGNVSSSGGL